MHSLAPPAAGGAIFRFGCIGVLLYDGSGNVAAGLSVSAPIERPRMAWVDDVIEAGRTISGQMGYRAQDPA